MKNNEFGIAYHLAMMDLTARFRTAKLGFHWFYIQQIVWAIGAGTVWSIVFQIPLEQFLPFIIVSFNAWTLISTFIIDSSASYQNAAGYLKNTNANPLVYVNKIFVSALIIFAISLVPLILLIPFVNSEYLDISIPYFLLSISILGFCLSQLSYVLAFIGVIIRDLTPALQSLMQVLFIASPVIYPPSLIKNKGFDWALEFNPFYHALEIIRSPILRGELANFENFLALIGIGLAFGIFNWFYLFPRVKRVALHV